MSFKNDILLDPIGLKLYKEFEKIQNGEIPESDRLLRELIEYVMERGYLFGLSKRLKFNPPESTVQKWSWNRLDTLPIPPEQAKEYDLLSRWQGVLSVIHNLEQRVLLLLMRKKGITKLYLASAALRTHGVNEQRAGERLRQVMINSMPGIGIENLDVNEAINEITTPISAFKSTGLITGVPSFRKDTPFGLLQTLDKLTVGIKDDKGNEMDYCVAVVSEPIDDYEIAETISKMRQFVDEIHPQMRKNETTATNQGQSWSLGISVDIIKFISSVCGGVADTVMGGIKGAKVGPIGSAVGDAKGGIYGVSGAVKGTPGPIGLNFGTNKSISVVKATSREKINSFAQNAVNLTQKHINRLEKGRNLGFWNTGVYVFSDLPIYTQTVMGMLRSVYSGDESYVEPFRMHTLHEGSDASNIIHGFQLVPLKYDTEEWHMFGKCFQYAGTPVNTEELSLLTSLPRNDVPGLRVVKIGERFANNPAKADGTKTINLGQIMDRGEPQSTHYTIPIDSLVRHALVTGSTGFGKSTTSWMIVSDVLKNNIPVLIIEPENDFFLKKALAYNKITGLSDDKKFNIYVPGTDSYFGDDVNEFHLNPFQSAVINATKRDILTRVEMIASIFSQSIPASDILPVLIEETLLECAKEITAGYHEKTPIVKINYPKLENAIAHAQKIMNNREYDPWVKANLTSALETRFKALIRLNRGDILNVYNSTPYEQLFDRPTVVNLKYLAVPNDKALITALIILSLNEYRKSQYMNKSESERLYQKDKLLHLTVVEEAHNILRKPQVDFAGVGNAQKVVADMFSNILSQIRALGQGIMLIDQIPSRLVEDAVKNTNYKIVHRLNTSDEAEMMAMGLCLRPEQIHVIPKLEQRYALVYGDKDDAASWIQVREDK